MLPMKKSDLAGTRQVFVFTLTQYFKNKSTIITLVTMFLLSAVMMGVMGFSGGTAMDETGIHPDFYPDESLPELSVAIINETDLPLSAADVERNYYASPLSLGIFAPDAPVEFDADTVRITVGKSEDGYTLDYYLPDDLDLSAEHLYSIEEALMYAIDTAHCRAVGISADALAAANAPVYYGSFDLSDYLEQSPDSTPDALDPANGGLFALSYAYSIVVLMLVMFSSSYIIRSVVEEKDSKLVELLMVSVKPLALILGKILATMLFVVAALAALFAGMGVTAALIGNISDSPDAISGALSGLGLDLSVTWRMILAIPALFISLLLAYFTFSLISGVMGACCSKMEDAGTATTPVALIALASYLLTTVGSVSGSYGFAVFCSVCPFVSVFFAPVSFVTGVIGFGTLALSWLLQAIIVVLLALFCARVYGALIIHRGSRIKLKALIALARGGGNRA